MEALNVLVTDPVGGNEEILRNVVEAGGHNLLVGTPSTWRDYLPAANGIICNLEKIGAAELAKAKNCRIVARLGIGVDSVDVAGASARGIWVTNVPRYCADEVAEHTLAMIMSLQRRLREAQADLENGRWNQLAYRGIHRASETALGIVGLGQLGRATAQRAAALGYRLLGHDPHIGHFDFGFPIRICEIDDLVETSDIVSLHLPLSAATRNLMDAARIARMKRGSYLVNVSRGGLVEEAALLDAIESGHLAGAALDAFENEPLSATSKLHRRPNLLLTPHIAFLSEESLVSLQRQAAEEILRVFSGAAPQNPVNEVPNREAF